MLKLIRFYFQLIKLPQTGLLTFTAIAGYRSATDKGDLLEVIIAMVGLLLVISGTTALNMVFDRDIDFIMTRTKNRPIPRDKITSRSGTIFGFALIFAGTAMNLTITVLYTLLVLAGLVFDLIIYTVWLKRRSPWSIIFGGISGGIPILAGRALALGHVDLIGFLLLLIILAWIPTHILTLAMNHSRDYKLAGVPTFPNVFGFQKARFFIAVSNIISAGVTLVVFNMLNVSTAGVVVCIISSIALLFLSLKAIIQPNEKSYFALFKYASIFMVGVMLILVLRA